MKPWQWAVLGAAILGISVLAGDEPPPRPLMVPPPSPPKRPEEGSGAGPLSDDIVSPLGTFGGDDIEAAARMLASENPDSGQDVWVEQIWTQLRSRKPGQSLHDRITGGQGWGPENGKRPVSTARQARAVHQDVARRVLRGELPSQLDGARKFFEPGQQDRVYHQVQQGKADLAAGRPISDRTRQLIEVGYKLDAQAIRDKWTKDGKHLVGTVGPVEFWT